VTSGSVGYVMRMFPQLSQTFVANEVLELERLGLPIHIFSYRRPSEDVPHECVRLITSPCSYLPDPLRGSARDLLQAHRAVYRRDPRRYRRVLRQAVSSMLRERTFDIWPRFVQAGYLAHLLQDGGVERLHAYFARGASRVALLASRLTGLPFSFSAHARDIYEADARILGELIEAAEFVATCTRANYEHLQLVAGPAHAGKIKLAYHGVNLAKFTAADGERDTIRPLILSAGRLVEKKGFRDLLAACAALRDKGASFRCVIVGDGPQRAELERLVAALGLAAAVQLPGSFSQEVLLQLYRQATIFALPCNVLAKGDRDGIPNVLLEAMAVGLPVVSRAISGIPELIQSGHNGMLVPESQAEGLASALELLLIDGDLRERLGSNARSTVERRFDSTANARVLASLFADGRRPAPRAAVAAGSRGGQ